MYWFRLSKGKRTLVLDADEVRAACHKNGVDFTLFRNVCTDLEIEVDYSDAAR